MRADHPAERGAALLTVLLLVSVISVIAASALERMRIATRLTANTVAIDQARNYAIGAEALTVTRINALLARNSGRVTLAGGWSGRPFSLVVPGGVIRATITDRDNCFNLNGLVSRLGPDRLAARPASMAQFARLMRLIGINDQVARTVAASTADWIDSDDDQQPLGAEDSQYNGRVSGYRTGATLMGDPSELRAVSGVTAEVYAKLKPWICALPIAKPARINVNTILPEQAPLFAMLFPDSLDIGRAHALLLERPAQGFTSTNEFWRLPARNGITPDGDAEGQVAVTSQWFALKVEVELGGASLNETALIDARTNSARLVSRAWGDEA